MIDCELIDNAFGFAFTVAKREQALDRLKNRFKHFPLDVNTKQLAMPFLCATNWVCFPFWCDKKGIAFALVFAIVRCKYIFKGAFTPSDYEYECESDAFFVAPKTYFVPCKSGITGCLV